MADPRPSAGARRPTATTAEPGTDNPAPPANDPAPPADGVVPPALDVPAGRATPLPAAPGLIMLGVESAPTCTDGVCQ